MTALRFYNELLQLGEVWEIKEVRLAKEQSEVDVYIRYTGKKALCPLSREMCRIHDYVPQRTWRHVDIMQYKTRLHCSIPRVINKEGKVSTIEVPWADYSKRYTYLFAAAVRELLHFSKNKRSTAAFFRTTFNVVHAIMERDVKRNTINGNTAALEREIGADGSRMNLIVNYY